MSRHAMPMRSQRLALGCGLALLLGMAPSVQAQVDPAVGHDIHTGDAWVDAQLRDIDLYAARYREAFIDELVRYHGAPRDAVRQWLSRPGWQAGDVYVACAIANVLARPCSEVVALRETSQSPLPDWQQLLDQLDADPRSDAFRRVKRGIVASYRHWARPVEPDADLRRMLAGESRAVAAAAHAARAGRARKSRN